MCYIIQNKEKGKDHALLSNQVKQKKHPEPAQLSLKAQRILVIIYTVCISKKKKKKKKIKKKRQQYARDMKASVCQDVDIDRVIKENERACVSTTKLINFVVETM